MHQAALIYNPRAGKKRRLIPSRDPVVTLEDIKSLLGQYEIQADFFPTRYRGHATDLANDIVKKGYKLILAAGGDGTVGEIISGLIKTDVTLGILPLGSYMNIARMLSIPTELEKAVQTVKIGRSRKIDVGEIVKINGKNLDKPSYFVESAGIGLEAQIFEYVQQLEQGNLKSLWRIVKTYIDFLHQQVRIVLDETEEISTRASMVSISNGPYMGAALAVAPKAKLNDHFLTISVFKMSKYELLKHFLVLVVNGKIKKNRKVQVYQSKTVYIETAQKRLVHADGRFFGQTPVDFKIIPNALSIITGFPKTSETSALIKRTYLNT